jgi:hypothetical protein
MKFSLKVFLVLAIQFITVILYAKEVHNYVFFGMDRDRISSSYFLENKNFEGAQLKYTWKELEPLKDKYDFSQIKKDLKFLNSYNKKLFIQIQDSTFSITRKYVPGYILTDKKYNGGAVYQYDFNDDETVGQPEGWVGRRWDPVVADRFHKLLFVLGEAFDGKVEGINLPETAIGVTENQKYRPVGFSYEKYCAAIKLNMKVAKEAFPNTVVIQYVNFMPGEFLPWTDNSYIRNIFNFAEKCGVGVGGPDLFPYKKSQMNNSYEFIHGLSKSIPVGISAQDGNFSYIYPKTKKKITIAQMYNFAKRYLKTDYIFWCTEEPYFSNEVIPFIKNLQKDKNMS